MNLALFDLDHTLLPIDSDFEWGQFLCRVGAVDTAAFERRNKDFFGQYEAGTLDAVEYLEFALGTLATIDPARLAALHQQFMAEVIEPNILPVARALLQKHLDAGDLVAIVTATNHFVTAPIAKAFGVEHLIAAMPEVVDGRITGRLGGTPTQGEGKIVHTKAWLEQMGKTLDHFDAVYFYSDSHNDLPLLSIVTHPVATNPNAALTTHATAQGWPLLHLFND
ncbi:HAD family hydrolase [Pseudoduganella buxea]|uniref:HAD-IB family hydrolase n=1 Tax=Pseudoduganella buxea TaxID=1949069 RepID=A0A6I3ST14_9BURK|nr:HAD family hydrolase [Pseudoduganella buxea]MTV52174.1 HAD-IB family hydrolase [Pseudoduganella buxea]GGB94220.1 haloacid dehalogenase [Pseudoduganella buxea]